MARDRGWKPFYGPDCVMGWNDVLEFDGDAPSTPDQPSRRGTEELILYLQTLFQPGNHVGYVTGNAFLGKDGK